MDYALGVHVVLVDVVHFSVQDGRISWAGEALLLISSNTTTVVQQTVVVVKVPRSVQRTVCCVVNCGAMQKKGSGLTRMTERTVP